MRRLHCDRLLRTTSACRGAPVSGAGVCGGLCAEACLWSERRPVSGVCGGLCAEACVWRPVCGSLCVECAEACVWRPVSGACRGLCVECAEACVWRPVSGACGGLCGEACVRRPVLARPPSPAAPWLLAVGHTRAHAQARAATTQLSAWSTARQRSRWTWSVLAATRSASTARRRRTAPCRATPCACGSRRTRQSRRTSTGSLPTRSSAPSVTARLRRTRAACT
eukprot:365237-Chlamydomonas_euryale.AAC.1